MHFGIGKGGTQQEAGTFGYQKVDAADMVDEMMYLIPKIMVEESLSHDGKWVQFEERSIHPKPYQDPHPPMYLACTGDESLTIAGSRGIGALALRVRRPRRDRPQERASTARRGTAETWPTRSASCPPSTSPRCARSSSTTTARRPAASACGASASSWSR